MAALVRGRHQSLEELVPPETIVISAGEKQWKTQADVLRTALEFHAKGGKLVRLSFPRTEVQHFGNVAIVLSSYVVETELEGTRSSSAGRVTEILNGATPRMQVDPETYEVRADGRLLTCEPASVLPMAQRYFLY